MRVNIFKRSKYEKIAHLEAKVIELEDLIETYKAALNNAVEEIHNKERQSEFWRGKYRELVKEKEDGLERDAYWTR